MTDIANRRLLNLKEKTLAYRFNLIHISGKRNAGADAASRYPASMLATSDSFMDNTFELAGDTSVLASVSSSLYAITNVVTWDMIREATTSDETLQELLQLIVEGFPTDGCLLSPQVKPYLRIASSLSCLDGVIIAGNRIVVPASLRRTILEALHAAHQGVGIMSARAADSVYWPNITMDIQRVRDECSHCHRIAKSNPMQPPADTMPPEYPFQKGCSQ